MIEILNPALLGGLVSVAAPIIVHIAHRRKIRSIDWGAMRFLMAMFARNRRRLLIEQWLLLAVRMLILACLGLALLRPAWRPSLRSNWTGCARLSATAWAASSADEMGTPMRRV